MLASFLISLLVLQQGIIFSTVNQPTVVNEAIKFEQIKDSPQSLGIKITAKSALVIDADTDQILFQKNSQQVLPIASITKLMTALIFLDSQPNWQKQVKIIANDNIEISESDKNNNLKLKPSQISFQVGELVKIEDLFATGLIKSANNSIKALVRSLDNCCGKTFVDRMNDKAKELGMINTVFEEPTGLSVNNQSTAEDIVLLLKEVIQKPKIQQTLVKKFHNFQTKDPGGENKFYQIKNVNKLLDSFIKIKAAKTGYLDEAGYCFAGLVEYNKKKLIIVLLGNQSEKDRLQEVKGLAWWAASIR